MEKIGQKMIGSAVWIKSYFIQGGQEWPPCSRLERGRELADSWGSSVPGSGERKGKFPETGRN